MVAFGGEAVWGDGRAGLLDYLKRLPLVGRLWVGMAVKLETSSSRTR